MRSAFRLVAIRRCFEQGVGRHLKCLGKIVDAEQRQIDMAILDLTEIGLGNPRDHAEFFLFEVLFFSEAGDIGAEQYANIHICQDRLKLRLSLFAKANI